MQSSASPTKIPVPFASAQSATYVQAVPTTKTTPGQASWNLGWDAETFLPLTSGGTPPLGEYANGVLLAITQCLRWIQAGGIFTRDLTFQAAIGGYPKGAILANVAGTGFWISTAENNTVDPETGTVTAPATGWGVLTPSTYPFSQITGVPSYVLNSAFTGSNQSLGINGYQEIPGGLIMQWGVHTSTANSEFVTFPTPFTTACLNVQCTVKSGNTGSTANAQALGYTQTGFTMISQGNERPTAWFAVGQ